MKDDVEWITVNGVHIPIKEGQSKDEAIRDHFGKEPPDNPENVKARLDSMKRIKEKEFSKPPIGERMEDVKNAYDKGKADKEKYGNDIESAVGKWHNTATSIESTAWQMGFDGEDLKEVTGWRYGNIPEGGRSVNHEDQSFEKGVSLMRLDGEKEKKTNQLKVAEMIFSSGKQRGKEIHVKGYLSGRGADGEPLIIGAERIK